MPTLVLTRSQIQPLIDRAALLPAMRSAFAAHAAGRLTAARRFPVALPPPAPAEAGAMLLAPGVLDGIPAYAVKVHAKFPGAEPAVRGVVLLHDLLDGRLLAVLESTLITAVRTGLAGAIAADALARPDAATVAVVGAGVQGAVQLETLALVRALRQVTVFDTHPGRAGTFARREGARLGVAVRPVETLADAVSGADMVVTATWARAPFLFPGMVGPGAHVTTLGPDQPGKCELDAALIRDALFVCDDRALAVEMGAIGGAGLGADAIHAELGEVLAGARPGRTAPEQITVFGSVGLAFQDLVVAWHVYREARSRGIGHHLDFLS